MMVGTSGAMRLCEHDRADERIAPGMWRYRLDRLHTLTGGALSDGGSAHAWLRETLKLPEEGEVERTLASREPGQHGLIVLPFWSGERSTGWAGDATAFFAGLKRHTTVIDIYQACIEAITYRFALLFDGLRHEGDPDKTIVATGGGLLASPAWLQIVADVTGNRVVASAVEEASLRGAALIALRDIGVIESDTIARAPVGVAYEPRRERFELYRAEIARQQQLYEREVGQDGVNLLARQTR
jgi:gluconokinase